MLKDTPHLKNINSDPAMTGMVKKPLKEGETVMGKSSKDYQPDIQISGVGISSRHCVINYDPATRIATVKPNDEDPEHFQIKINGE